MIVRDDLLAGDNPTEKREATAPNEQRAFLPLNLLVLDLKKTNWGAILETVPAMLALTFFGILHVPINVPALGVSTGRDNFDTNRELIAHGWSNLLSGCFGTVQSE